MSRRPIRPYDPEVATLDEILGEHQNGSFNCLCGFHEPTLSIVLERLRKAQGRIDAVRGYVMANADRLVARRIIAIIDGKRPAPTFRKRARR